MYYANGFLFVAWDLGVIFLGIEISSRFKISKIFFWKNQILRVIEKCLGWVPVYPF